MHQSNALKSIGIFQFCYFFQRGFPHHLCFLSLLYKWFDIYLRSITSIISIMYSGALPYYHDWPTCISKGGKSCSVAVYANDLLWLIFWRSFILGQVLSLILISLSIQNDELSPFFVGVSPFPWNGKPTTFQILPRSCFITRTDESVYFLLWEAV